MLVVAAAGERSLNRRINEQRCSPFIYFLTLATWDSLEPFLLLFRGSQRCGSSHSGGADGKESGGLTFTSAEAVVSAITAPVSTHSIPL